MSYVKIAKLGPPVRNSDGSLTIPVTDTGVMTKEMLCQALLSLYCADPNYKHYKPWSQVIGQNIQVIGQNIAVT